MISSYLSASALDDSMLCCKYPGLLKQMVTCDMMILLIQLHREFT